MKKKYILTKILLDKYVLMKVYILYSIEHFQIRINYGIFYETKNFDRC